MKTKFVQLSVISSILLLFSMPSIGQVTISGKGGMINLNECNLKISEKVEVDELPSPSGVIKPSVKTNKIFKVKLTGVAPREGSFLIKTYVFTAMYSYRGLKYLIPTTAIGVIGRNGETGEIVERWNKESNNIFTLGFGANSKITFDIAFEVPKEVKEIEIQVPMIIK